MTNLKKYRFEIFAIALFLLISIVYTYPLIFNLNKVVWGYIGDNFGAIWYIWWLRYAQQNNLPPDFTTLVNFPFGYKIDASLVEPVWQLFLQYFGLLFGEIFAFNLLIFLSFPLAAITMYSLVVYLTKNKLAATLVGLVYMLLPYHFWQSYQHVALSQIQWLPLYVLALLKLNSNPNVKNATFTAISFLLVVFSSVYHGYFMVLFTISFIVFKVLYKFIIERKNYLVFSRLKYFILTFVFIILPMFPFAYKFYQTRSDSSPQPLEVYKRPIENLLSLSARPWDFFIPPNDHSFFGKYEWGLYAKIRSFSNDYKTISAFLPERIMYVGIPSFFLALFGVYFSLKNRRLKELIIVLLGVSVFLAATAAPPFVIIKGKTIYLPSYFFYQILPIIRVYARLGIVIDLLVLIFAGFGLSFIFSKIRNKRVLAGVFSLFLLLFLFEFANFGRTKISDISKPPDTYKWLKEQTGRVNIIEYPRTFDVATSLLYQRYHQKGIFSLSGSFAPTSSYTPIWDLIENPTSYDTAKVLSALGLDYALIHVKTPFNMINPFDEVGLSQIVEEGRWVPLKGNGISGFEVVSSFDDGFFVKIVANPDKLIIFEEKKVRFLPDSGDWFWKDSRNTLYFLNIKNKPLLVNLKFEPYGFNLKDLKMMFNYREENREEEIELRNLDKPLKINPGISALRFEILEAQKEFGLKNISISEIKSY